MATDANLFRVTNYFNDTVSRYLSREAERGKDTWRSLHRMMRMWVSFAANKIPRGKEDDISRYYHQKFRNSKTIRRKKRSAAFMEWRETMALLRVLKYTNLKATRGKKDQLYIEARKYMNRRRYATGVHRGGFKPAFKRLGPPIKGANLGRIPKYDKFTTGDILFNPEGETPTADQMSIIVTNYAKVIEKIAPKAFEYAMKEVAILFNGYLIQDMIKEQMAAGLNAKKS